MRWLLCVVCMLLLTAVVTLPNIGSNGIDDLDSAHHLMDGYFFRDLVRDVPIHHPAAYVLAYYKQYPALGFLFWPPLVPAVYGVFCVFGGVHVLAVRACMFCFGLLFCLSYYAVLRRRLSVALSAIGVIVVATVPGVVWSFNEIMLELPTLAFMCLAVLAYYHFTDTLEEPGTYWRALICALACGALVYSKQPAWFLLPALAIDYLVRVRRGRWHPQVLLAAVLVVLLDTPMALFTLRFGKANLGQSLGSSTTRIMPTYHALSRGSWAAWTYYPHLAVSALDVVVVTATLAACVLAFTHRRFFRTHVLWFAWLAMYYITFSYYDNRSARHATFWWPAWVALAVAAVSVLQAYLPSRSRWVLPAVLLLPVPFHVRTAWRTQYTEYTGVQQAVGQLFAVGNPGTILAFGPDKQVLTAVIREHDSHRLVHIIRGERLLSPEATVASLCHDFRVNTVLVEAGATEPPVNVGGGQPGTLHEVSRTGFLRRGQPMTLVAYRYSGPLAEKAAEVSLSSALTQ